ncbi:CRISPR-associated protein, Crm2 family [Thiorhodococcus drewsii AZ1]|uniref:CRISPR-associated protein, Crm2 family n=1 Tax=Thiorhodococcus drewsii AZ1 TaxID=765913 RepID=G2DYK7_9GAMM|nr:type III-B CRISPR-associated protein Cas10/Cmr2 [Thiorhodococcus drewsii]EGV32634.1 CRISPR-associated protein, Crm2 family [Thiorhodococcus drewsii AZ1]
MSDQTFHFTLGPVQGFVAQARRTRDFWAGSFLLSWLAGAAMLAVKQQGGTIDFPSPDDGYLGWLTGKGSGDTPRQGCIPNRFKAIQCKVPGDFDPVHIEQSVRDAWRALAESVWTRDLRPHDPSADTRAIWERQIDGFWEISWALGEDNSLLDRRKNWRTHLPPVEGGVKCSMMAGWQELSGAVAPGDACLKDFWEGQRKQFPRDFDEGEHLCAIAFIKRRFVGAFAKLSATMPDGWTLHGWQLDGQMPSTLDLAAAHWVAGLDGARSEDLETLRAATENLLDGSDGGLRLLRCVRETRSEVLTRLHSSALFPHVLENRALCQNRDKVKEVRKALKILDCKTPPAPFYAILLMDGDSLGQLLQTDLQAPPKISRALNAFTSAVPELVDQHNGFLIYAGGDDVLALLPLEDALGCATAIRAVYLAAFKEAFGKEGCSTISAAVTFAHVKIPLTRLLRDSHHLLDDIAKDATGRDALAVRVVKSSGEALQWARPWLCALSVEAPEQLTITRLAERFAADESGEAADFSSKFFYRIRERFAFLNPPKGQPDAEAIFDLEQATSLLAVDYLASGVNRGLTLKIQEAEALIRPLLKQCSPVRRYTSDEDKPRRATQVMPMVPQAGIEFYQQPRLEADAALLVRFLAQKGRERS